MGLRTYPWNKQTANRETFGAPDSVFGPYDVTSSSSQRSIPGHVAEGLLAERVDQTLRAREMAAGPGVGGREYTVSCAFKKAVPDLTHFDRVRLS